MPVLTPNEKVLVTGANGFTAIWAVKVLLERGYTVRGTVRSMTKGNFLKKMFVGMKLEIVEVPDITREGAFDEALKDVQGVLHIASPAGISEPGADPQEFIKPAVDGTLSLLKSMAKSQTQVKRVVITSSTATLRHHWSLFTESPVLDETDWNTTSVDAVKRDGASVGDADKYYASKVLAEQGAWDFYNDHKAAIKWDLCILLPPLIVGPILQESSALQDVNGSMRMVYERTIAPGTCHDQTLLATTAYGAFYIDVRDAALGHALALEKPDAGGERIIIAAGSFVWQDWLDAIHDMKPFPFDDDKRKLIPVGTPGSGKEHGFPARLDTSKSQRILGMKYMSLAETAEDIVYDFIAHGW